jgi:hypothetical protein
MAQAAGSLAGHPGFPRTAAQRPMFRAPRRSAPEFAFSRACVRARSVRRREEAPFAEVQDQQALDPLGQRPAVLFGSFFRGGLDLGERAHGDRDVANPI